MSWLDVVGDVVTGGAVSLISGLIGGSNQRSANESNVDLWREQAEYNKPINQLARLREAGLNPNLIYGSGAVQNTITSAPKMEPNPTPDLMAGLMLRQQILNGEAQRKLLEEQTSKTNLEKQNIVTRIQGNVLDNIFKSLENDYKGYENAYYKEKGIVKGDPVWLRYGGALGQIMLPYVLAARGMFTDGYDGSKPRPKKGVYFIESKD